MAYAKVLKSEFNSLGDCTICQLPLNDARILYCRHEFCKDCISKWIVNSPLNKSESKENGIDCPICRQVTEPPQRESSPSKWADHLPRHENMGTSQETATPVENCDPCRSINRLITAVVFCSDCEEYLCKDCHFSHKKLKISRGHTVLELDTGPEASLEVNELKKLSHCRIHEEKEFEFYCHDHEQLVCSTCAFIYHRHCTNVAELDKDAGLASRSMSSFITLENTKNLLSHVNEVITVQKDYEKLLQQDFNELPTKLKQFRDKINKKLDRFDARMLQESKDMHSGLDQAVKQKRTKCEAILRRLNAHLKIAETHKHLNRSSRKHFVLSCTLKQERELIRSELYMEGRECLPKEFKQFKLKINKDFDAMLDQEANFGGLTTINRKMKSLPLLPDEKTTLDCNLIVHDIALTDHMRTTKHSKAMGCHFLNDNQIAVADKAKLMYIFDIEDEENNSQMRLKYQPWGMAFLPSQNVMALSHPSDRKISIYNMNDGPSFSHEIKTRKECYGLASCNDHILVSLCDNLNEWSLGTMSLKGEMKQEFDRDANDRQFKSFWYFIADGNSIYQACSDTNHVYKFSLDSHTPEFQYSSDQLLGPTGIAIDVDKNIYVCGMISKNIHIITQDGMAIGIFKPPECSIPMAIACRPGGGYFVVIDNGKQSGAHLYKFLM